LTNAITKDGQTNITANIPMSNFKITGLGAGTNPNDAVRLAQIQDGIINGRFVNLEYTGTFTGGTGVVNLGSGQFYKDASGNVGIGTASPQSKLTIQDAGSGAVISAMIRNGDAINFHRIGIGYNSGALSGYIPANAMFIEAAAGGGFGALGGLAIGTGSSAPVIFGTSATEKMRIDPSGNVGIGTISPAYKFEVQGSVNGFFGQRIYNTNAGSSAVSYLQIGNDTNGATAQLGLNSSTNTTNIGGANALYLVNGLTAPVIFGTNNTERMRINASGNVGIGGTPSNALDVFAATGTITVSSTTGTNFSKVQVNNTGGSFQLAIDNSAGTNYGSTVAYARCVWNDSTTAPTLFYTNFAERMRIDASGNVSIKVTSAIGRFNVQSDDSATAIAAGNASGTAAYNGALFYNNGFTSLVGQISISGSTASYLSVSDYRLKESVAPMTGALATVAALKPVTYKWKADGSDGQGFIAHELQAVVPDCVTGDKDAVDAEGKPKYQGVDTSFLVATLTAAIQEQQAIISAMETRLAALEA
jgi:hypothetical protein